MNLGFGELLIILVVVLLIVGAKRLPEVGRSLGEAVKAFQDAIRGNAPDDKNKPSE